MIYLCKGLVNLSSRIGCLSLTVRSLHQSAGFASRQPLFKGLLQATRSGQDSLVSNNHLTLFVRRNRFTKNNGKRDDLDKNVKIKSNEIRRLLGLAKEERFKIGAALVLLAISSGVTMFVPFFIGKLIDFIQKGDRETMKEKLKNISLIMLGVFVVGALANFGRVYIIQSTGQRIVMRLRKKLFGSIMQQDMAFFDKNKTGELVNRLVSDTEVVGLSISQNLSDGLRSTLQAAGGVGMMLYVSPVSYVLRLLLTLYTPLKFTCGQFEVLLIRK